MPKRKKNTSPDEISRPISPAPSIGSAGDRPSWWLAAAVLAISIAAVYVPAVNVPFIFDDHAAISDNNSIVSLWPLIGTEHPGPLNPESRLPTTARPLVNLSFAVNYYFGGLNPRGYHATNVVIHFCCAMFLWAVVWRTLALPYFKGRYDRSARWLALTVALIWALHPLQTEAVIYATQRTELMMAMSYLATLYCSQRYWETSSRLPRIAWLLLAVATCACGMASKEVMVSAPLMILLYERTFVAGYLKGAFQKSWPLYIGLASTWLVLLALSISAPHSASAGFSLGVPLLAWWLTQTQVLLMYLKLAVWPSPLLLHYQLPYLDTFAAAWMHVFPILLLGFATLLLLWRNMPLGYLGTWIFAILAPTSFIPIIVEMAAERRMYLPLAALVVLFVVGSYLLVLTTWHRWASSRLAYPAGKLFRALAALLTLAIVIGLGVLSAQRLTEYDDPAKLWRQVIEHQPQNFMAHNGLGFMLLNAGRTQEAIPKFETALQLKPDFQAASINLGLALTRLGRAAEAIEVLQRALAEEYGHGVALNNIGVAFAEVGKNDEAIKRLQEAIRLYPNYPDPHSNLGNIYINMGRFPDALDELNTALTLRPDYAGAHNNLGRAMIYLGRYSDAIESLERALKIKPDFDDAHDNLGAALVAHGNASEAMEHFKQAIKLNPNHLNAHKNLGLLLAQMGDAAGAIDQIEAAITLARAGHKEVAARQLEQWLTDYRAELGGADATSTPAPPVQPAQ